MSSTPTSSSSQRRTKKRPPVQRAPDADRVLAQCRKLRAKLQQTPTSTPVTTETPSNPAATTVANIVQVHNLPAPQVLNAMDSIALSIADQVLSPSGGFSFSIPSRSASNQLYDATLDRIVLGPSRLTRHFGNVSETRKSAITLRVLELLYAVLVRRIHITKRDLFYTDVKLFVDQSESDGVLDDIATMVGCTRSK